MTVPRLQLVPAPATGGEQVWGHARRETWVGPVFWRLLGANNRELGRSVVVYEDAEACRSAVDDLSQISVTGEGRVSPVARGLGWRWQVLVDGEVVATSGRTHRRERESRYNLEQFLRALPEAVERWRHNGSGHVSPLIAAQAAPHRLEPAHGTLPVAAAEVR